MKKITIICIFLAFSSAIIPLCLFYPETSETQNVNSQIEDTNIVFMNKTQETQIIYEALKFSDEDFCDETLKALLVLVRNNLEVSGYENNTEDFENKAELQERLKNLLKSTETELLYKGKKVYIPLAELSSGYISTSDEYPYIKTTASPWDCLSPKFIYNKDYAPGISIYGIDYLCKEGLSSEEALTYYLEDFEIK